MAIWTARADHVPIIPGFLRPIDTSAIAKQLRLAQHGHERGTQELPRSEDENLDSIEQTVVQKVQAEWAWQGDALLKTLRAYADRLVGYSVSAEAAKLRLVARDAGAQFSHASIQANAELGPLQEAYIASRDEVENFRTKHRLSRPARLPSSRAIAFGLLVVIVALESALNGVFFAKGSELGLIGGVGTAVGISVVNVAFAFLLGLAPARFVNYRKLFVRSVAATVTLIGMLALIALHAFAVHYRDAMESVSEAQAFEAAIQSFIRQPWSMNSLTSLYLFALGILFAVTSFWKGYRFDDPYPFYGSLSRRKEAARIEYSDEHRALFDELERVKDETIAQIKAGMNVIPLFPQRAAQIRTQRVSQLDAFRAYEASVETAANQLLQIYRDANSRNRTTPSPAHFTYGWHLPHSFLESSQAVELATDAHTKDAEINSILVELSRDCNNLLDQYAQLLERYPHPTSME